MFRPHQEKVVRACKIALILICSVFLKFIVSLSLVFSQILLNISTDYFDKKIRLYKIQIGMNPNTCQ